MHTKIRQVFFELTWSDLANGPPPLPNILGGRGGTCHLFTNSCVLPGTRSLLGGSIALPAGFVKQLKFM